jgi:hypothetical protein
LVGYWQSGNTLEGESLCNVGKSGPVCSTAREWRMDVRTFGDGGGNEWYVKHPPF